MKKVYIVLFLLLLIGCKLYEQDIYHSFTEVSQPYLDQYGPPEDIEEFISGDYHSIDWWWWSQGFMVCFVDSPYDSTWGWRVDSTYSFSPI